MSLFSQFSDKSEEKVAREKNLSAETRVLHNTDRKMKDIIRRIFASIIMHPNFIHFC